MQLVDTHVHINFEDFQKDIEAVRDRWRANGISRLVHSCVTPDEFTTIKDIADRFPEVSFAVGLHPLDRDLDKIGWQPEIGDRIRELAQSDPRVVAIGETGLDFFKAENKQAQIQAFQAQLAIARDLNLPVIVHCRDAAATARDVIKEFNTANPDRPARGVMHCWTGTPAETQWFIDLGFYISFSGVVTFKTAETVRESIKVVGDDRLLVETDCPFLAPVPKRGKRNEPAYVLHVAEKVAEVRGEDLATLADRTTQNAYALFNLT
jgi:TatD DNase family protein